MALLFSRNDSTVDESSDAAAAPRLPALDVQRFFDISQDFMCLTDAQGRFVRVSRSSSGILGYSQQELIGHKFLDLVHPADVQRTFLAYESILRGAQVIEFENRYIRSDGSLVYLSWTASWSVDADRGTGVCYGIARDISNRKRAEVVRESQREVLHLIAQNAPLQATLRRICSLMETFDSDAKCAVTLFAPGARRIETIASPSLPSRFLTMIQESLLNNSVSSHAATLRGGQTVICIDMHNDDAWSGISQLTAEHGLEACWLTPVFDAHGEFIATIDVFYSQRCEPTRRELVLVQTAATMVTVAVEHARAQNKADMERQRYLTQLSALADAARKVNSLLTVDELLQVITDIARDLVGAHIAISTLKSGEDDFAEMTKTSCSTKYPALKADCMQWPATNRITVSLVLAAGRQIGTLCIADKHEGEFTPNDERVLAQLADLAAVGLENARLYAEMEERVRRRTRELQDSNRELEAFSYSVSHDLRGPLRAIAGFTGLLRDRHYETIDAEGRRYIDRVLAGTQRMSNLIDDLLELGRVTRVEIRRRQVDLSEYARAILARLREAAPERAATIVIEPHLRIEGDPGLLEIALENLLDNAWKFTAGRPVAEIRFGTVRDTDQHDQQDAGHRIQQEAGHRIQQDAGHRTGERIFFVQDNGVGFDPRYAANLFGVFQRLHAAGEFPGTGVGLATVQRIVQRHGGRIWAEAGVDRGATIYFSIATTGRTMGQGQQ